MQIIPVLDVLNGQVVHAQRGDRSRYAPLVSPLCTDARPESVVAGLLSLSSFQQLYIADLNAIQQRGPQWLLLYTLIKRFPQVRWWVDGGFTSLSALQNATAWMNAQRSAEFNPMAAVRWVLGSETFTGVADLHAEPDAPVLSLDFGPEGFRGDPGWLTAPHLWPDDVAVMSLAHVGAQNGPDIERLRTVVAAAGVRRVYAAGGVRHNVDVDELTALGVAGALVATALHQGTLLNNE